MSDQSDLNLGELDTKVIVGATLIDGTGRPQMPDSAVVIAGDRIEWVGARGDLETQPDADVIDARNRFLLPGMIELHSHMYHPSMVGANMLKREPDAYAALYAHNNLRQALQAGITTIREVAQVDGLDLSLRRAINEGVVTGPRLFVSGRGICMTGGHGSILEGFMIEADGPHEIVKAIRRQVRDGVDLIKILTSHRDETPEYTQEELDAAVHEAHRLGKRIAAHAASRTATEMVVKAGIDTVEHGTFLGDDTVAMMADQGTFWVPTCYVICLLADFVDKLMASAPQLDPAMRRELELAKKWGDLCVGELPRSFERILEAGVRIGAGTDAIGRDMVYASLPEELEHLVQFGCTPMQAIESATRIGAEALGVETDLGTIEKGKYADMVMVDRDPCKDITAMQKVTWVMKGGAVVPFAPEYERHAGKTPWALTGSSDRSPSTDSSVDT